MEPHGRYENQEDIIAGMIRGEEVIVDDVTEQFLNDSGEGDESLNRGGRSSGEVEADASGEGGLSGSDKGEADEGEAGGSGGTLKIANSDEVHIYINELSLCYLYTYINALCSFSPTDGANLL